MASRSFFRDTSDLHTRMEDLTAVLGIETDPDESTRLSGELVSLLIPHIETEEEVLYTALHEAVDRWEDRCVLLQAHAEHKMILHLIEDLQNTSSELEDFKGIVLLLDKFLCMHIEEEEDLLYDMANRYLSYTAFAALEKRMREVQKVRLRQVREEARRSNRVPTVLQPGDQGVRSA